MANDEDLARLRQGAAIWKRAENPERHEDLARLRQGAAVWNDWRAQNPERHVDLGGAHLFQGEDLRLVNLAGVNLFRAVLAADLRGADLSGATLNEACLSGADLAVADLSGASLVGTSLFDASLFGAHLSGADLSEARLQRADLRLANLAGANLHGADLAVADLTGANLTGASFRGANLGGANLGGANLGGANLLHATLVGTNLTAADLTGCRVYGISAWNLKLEGAKQCDLVITRQDEPEITVDNLEVAQFIYLLLNNEKIRDVIDTIGKKGVLLLGRFTEGRLAVLERLRAELRKRDFVPMVFNFDKPETKDFTETVRLLAGLSRFVIVDITNPRSAPLELQATVPEYMIPFVPIIEEGGEPFAMFQDLRVKHSGWVLDPIAYGSVEELVRGLDEEIIKPALARFDELVVKKAEKLRVRRIGTRSTAAPFA